VWAATLTALLALAGCGGREEPPAPVDVRAVGRSPQAAPGAPAAVAGAPAIGARAVSYTVERGDTAYAVARRFDVPVKAIIDANSLQPPYGLLAGQRLTIPQPRAHLVVPGDTVQSVARQYGVDASSLVRLNALPPPYTLRPGQRLALPASVAGIQQASATAEPLPPVAPLPPPSTRAVEVATLAPPPAAANPPPASAPPPTPPPAAIAPPPPAAAPPPAAPVQTARKEPPPKVPAAEAATAAGAPAAAASAAAPAPPAPPPAEPAPAATAAAAPAASAEPAQAGERSSQVAALPAPPAAAVEPAPGAAPAEPAVASPPHDATPVGPPPPRAGKTFLWPLRGRVISTYGEQGQGLHNDGLNIAAPRGTPIKAAENGVVAYAGNEIRGFGNLLLIRHAGGFMTAYAHADSLLVKRGDTVHRGQTIARVGQSGSVTEPQLHFEIREGSQPVDPQRYLGSPTS